MEMRVAGAGPDAYVNFARPLSLLYARLSSYPFDRGLTQELLERARQAGDGELVTTLEIVTGQRPYWPRVLARKVYLWRLRRKKDRKARHRARRQAAPSTD